MTGTEWELADSAAENFGRSNARAKRQRAVVDSSVRVLQARLAVAPLVDMYPGSHPNIDLQQW